MKLSTKCTKFTESAKAKRAGLAVGVVAAVTMVMAPAAMAAGALSVDGATSPVGNVAVTAVNKGTVSFITDFGTPMSCTTSSVTGYVIRGASVTIGTKIGAITNLTFGSAGTPCGFTVLNLPVVIAKNVNTGAPAEWEVRATATPAAGATTVPIVINNVSAKMHSTGATPWVCDMRLQGNVAGTFNQVTQRITIATAPAFPLAIRAYDGTGTKTNAPSGITCGGQIYTGDSASMSGAFTLTTPGVGGIHF